jgi:hypothetical protein
MLHCRDVKTTDASFDEVRIIDDRRSSFFILIFKSP